MSADEPVLSCPSAQPDMVDADAFGVVTADGGQPRVAYLKKNARVGGDVLESLGPIDPTHVFRFSARCEGGRCAQFEGGRCSLGQRITEQLPAVVAALPSCRIRNSCRWFAEIGHAACLRCPQVVTLVPPEQNRLRRAAQPEA